MYLKPIKSISVEKGSWKSVIMQSVEVMKVVTNLIGSIARKDYVGVRISIAELIKTAYGLKYILDSNDDVLAITQDEDRAVLKQKIAKEAIPMQDAFASNGRPVNHYMLLGICDQVHAATSEFEDFVRIINSNKTLSTIVGGATTTHKQSAKSLADQMSQC